MHFLKNRFSASIVLMAFIVNVSVTNVVFAQDMRMSGAGQRIGLTSSYQPAVLKGLKIHPNNPLRFDFIVDQGNSGLNGQALVDETTSMVKYFLAALAISEKDLWVNLSPYEKDRIIPEAFGQTDMGRDLLALDYTLKQLTASLMYPEDDFGKKFWAEVYAKANKEYGNINVPINTFNKVWIVPQEATVYQNGPTAFVAQSHLKVMLEADYLASHKASASNISPKPKAEGLPQDDSQEVGSQVIKDIVIPVLEKEINEGSHFANLRQIYAATILAKWYKQALKESLLGQAYADQSKINGIDIADKNAKQKIYEQYVEAYKKGVYNYIKEEFDENTQSMVPRKYFSGGVPMSFAMNVVTNPAALTREQAATVNAGTTSDITFDFKPVHTQPASAQAAMIIPITQENSGFRAAYAIRDTPSEDSVYKMKWNVNHYELVSSEHPEVLLTSPTFRLERRYHEEGTPRILDVFYVLREKDGHFIITLVNILDRESGFAAFDIVLDGVDEQEAKRLFQGFSVVFLEQNMPTVFSGSNLIQARMLAQRVLESMGLKTSALNEAVEILKKVGIPDPDGGIVIDLNETFLYREEAVAELAEELGISKEELEERLLNAFVNTTIKALRKTHVAFAAGSSYGKEKSRVLGRLIKTLEDTREADLAKKMTVYANGATSKITFDVESGNVKEKFHQEYEQGFVFSAEHLKSFTDFFEKIANNGILFQLFKDEISEQLKRPATDEEVEAALTGALKKEEEKKDKRNIATADYSWVKARVGGPSSQWKMTTRDGAKIGPKGKIEDSSLPWLETRSITGENIVVVSFKPMLGDVKVGDQKVNIGVSLRGKISIMMKEDANVKYPEPATARPTGAGSIDIAGTKDAAVKDFIKDRKLNSGKVVFVGDKFSQNQNDAETLLVSGITVASVGSAEDFQLARKEFTDTQKAKQFVHAGNTVEHGLLLVDALVSQAMLSAADRRDLEVFMSQEIVTPPALTFNVHQAFHHVEEIIVNNNQRLAAERADLMKQAEAGITSEVLSQLQRNHEEMLIVAKARKKFVAAGIHLRHFHTNAADDGDVTPEQLVDWAIENNVTAMYFTTHFLDFTGLERAQRHLAQKYPTSLLEMRPNVEVTTPIDDEQGTGYAKLDWKITTPNASADIKYLQNLLRQSMDTNFEIFIKLWDQMIAIGRQSQEVDRMVRATFSELVPKVRSKLNRPGRAEQTIEVPYENVDQFSLLYQQIFAKFVRGIDEQRIIPQRFTNIEDLFGAWIYGHGDMLPDEARMLRVFMTQFYDTNWVEEQSDKRIWRARQWAEEAKKAGWVFEKSGPRKDIVQKGINLDRMMNEVARLLRNGLVAGAESSDEVIAKPGEITDTEIVATISQRADGKPFRLSMGSNDYHRGNARNFVNVNYDNTSFFGDGNIMVEPRLVPINEKIARQDYLGALKDIDTVLSEVDPINETALALRGKILDEMSNKSNAMKAAIVKEKAAAQEAVGGIDLGDGTTLKVINTGSNGMLVFDPVQFKEFIKDFRGVIPVPVSQPLPVHMPTLSGLLQDQPIDDRRELASNKV